MKTTQAGNDLALQLKVAFLQRRETYPFPTSSVEVMETHLSYVFLTDKYAFKLKKPVKLEFLDFSTPQARYKNFTEELRLNQRLARGVYLGIIPITAVRDGELKLDGHGEPIDWVLWMKRLPSGSMLDELIRTNSVHVERVEQAAKLLAEFYKEARNINMSMTQYKERLTAEICRERDELLNPRFKLSSAFVNKIADNLLDFITRHDEVWAERIRQKRIMETHGDLRPEHIYIGQHPAIIDCLEFNRNFKIMDVAEELALLLIECEMLGDQSPANTFLKVYEEINEDPIPETLLYFYQSKRALLRARLSIRHLLDKSYRADPSKWVNRCNAYLFLADQYADRMVMKNNLR